MAIRVVKVGGSLFDLPDLAGRLSSWLAEQTPATALLVAGGGPIADQVRQLDLRFQLTPEAAHQMAVWAMRIHARTLLELLDEACWLPSVDRVHGGAAGQTDATCVDDGSGRLCTWILDPVLFVERDERMVQPDPPLPCGWHVTSDSIAARVAQVVRADELVLLKSRDATDAGVEGDELVDPYFHNLVPTIPVVRSVNLRKRAVAEGARRANG